MKKTKEKLESTDKFLKASITITDFDTLIKKRTITTSRQRTPQLTVHERIAEAWMGITSQKTDPKIFLENTDIMKKRLFEVVSRFGAERVPYAGPECGLKSFPTYECALECLRRVSSATMTYSKSAKT